MVAGAEGTAGKQTKPLPSGSSCFAVCVYVCVCVCVLCVSVCRDGRGSVQKKK